MERIWDARALGWLERRCPGDSTTECDSGWERSVWILNAMYETDELPGGLSHNDGRLIEEAAGISAIPQDPPALAGIMARATLTGGGLGWSEHPGPGWRRVSWSELGRRLDVNPFGQYLDHGSFPYESWPINIAPPTEGSLDREQYSRLLEHLDDATPGADSTCFAFYGLIAANTLVESDDAVGIGTLYHGLIRDLGHFCDDAAFGGSPTNIWPDHGSWLVYTDWDLSATKVNGSAGLIDRLIQDSELETVGLPN
jgi:hypothetical protein